MPIVEINPRTGKPRGSDRSIQDVTGEVPTMPIYPFAPGSTGNPFYSNRTNPLSFVNSMNYMRQGQGGGGFGGGGYGLQSYLPGAGAMNLDFGDYTGRYRRRYSPPGGGGGFGGGGYMGGPPIFPPTFGGGFGGGGGGMPGYGFTQPGGGEPYETGRYVPGRDGPPLPGFGGRNWGGPAPGGGGGLPDYGGVQPVSGSGGFRPIGAGQGNAPTGNRTIDGPGGGNIPDQNSPSDFTDWFSQIYSAL